MSYNVVDRNNEPLNQTPFATERKAIEAKRVYEDHCYEPRPYKVVKAEEEEEESSSIPCSMCGKPTSFDPTYGDICYRCCRASNE